MKDGLGPAWDRWNCILISNTITVTSTEIIRLRERTFKKDQDMIRSHPAFLIQAESWLFAAAVFLLKGKWEL